MTPAAAGGAVVVVGAGLAGLVAARTLAARGRAVVVLDRGAGPGGRAATVTVDDAAADTGAQFFTVRNERFAALVADWRDEGVPVREWTRGFWQVATISDHPETATLRLDGHPRYVVDGGMATLAAHLAAGLDLRLGREVDPVSRSAEGWSATAGDAVVHGSALVCAGPLPEAAALVGRVTVPAPVATTLAQAAYRPCIAVVARLDAPPSIPAPGAVQCAAGTVSWLADNHAKGLSPQPCVTIHAGADWSADHWTDPDARVADELLDVVRGWLGGAAAVTAVVQRWRHAAPVEVSDVRVLVVADDPPLLLAGDGCGGPRVEGAVLSGLAAADRLAG